MLVVDATTDQALYAEDRVFWVRDSLTLGRLTSETFIVRERNDRRRRAGAFCVLDYTRLRAIHDSHAGVSCTEVDTNDFSHVLSLS
mmetsp:Transcript_548/g.838  ORF Transcript_548/g.838 Transcript_548/m.838 type:complete len:86 (-) Transcript_548:57-314(-)